MADKFSFDLRRIKKNSFFLVVMRDVNNWSKRYSIRIYSTSIGYSQNWELYIRELLLEFYAFNISRNAVYAL